MRVVAKIGTASVTDDPGHISTAAISKLVDEVADLRETVAAPSAAEPEVRNRLGKSLLESGRDAQRAGAKR